MKTAKRRKDVLAVDCFVAIPVTTLDCKSRYRTFGISGYIDSCGEDKGK
jgi:hypothetical protein